MAKATCSVEDCLDPVYHRGYCPKHYGRWYRHGDPLAGRAFRSKSGPSTCSVEDCTDPVDARSYCQRHYQRFLRTGDPLEGGLRTESERLWALVDVRGPDECWPWTGLTDKDGYGVIRTSHGHRAPRAAWAIANGQPIPDGLLIRHTCDNPPCCNPAHLILGTHLQNMADKRERGRHLFGDAHWSRREPERVPRGDANVNHKLTDAQVAEIRSRITGRYGELLEMAGEYGVSVSLIRKIKAGVNRPPR